MWSVIVSRRIAEIDETAVPAVVGDMAAVFGNGLVAGDLPEREDFRQLFGIKAFGERRRIDEVAKHDSEASPLGLAPSRCRRGRGGLGRMTRIHDTALSVAD